MSALEKSSHLWRFTTLHGSCAAHFADQWAGQLKDTDTDAEKKWVKVRKIIKRV